MTFDKEIICAIPFLKHVMHAMWIYTLLNINMQLNTNTEVSFELISHKYCISYLIFLTLLLLLSKYLLNYAAFINFTFSEIV